jgi:DNA polymerase-4
MDSFFASVEVLDNPALVGLPVLVGGTGPRGVVASCSYQARMFGIRSAMPMARARRLCPSAVVLAGRFMRYEEMSRQLREVLRGVTPIVEPIGLDEAFLDVTGALRLLGGGHALAVHLRSEVHGALALDCAVGVARSKLMAKLASRAAKPRADRSGIHAGPGVVVIEAHDELPFLHPLPVRALWGVGPATAKRLSELGVQTVGDLAQVPADTLVRQFGRAHGSHLAELAQARDPSPVVPDRPTKSIGHEETFSRDLFDSVELRQRAARLCQSVASHLHTAGVVARTVSLKVRFADFSLATRSHTVPVGLSTAPAIELVVAALLDAVDTSGGIRLLGVSAAGLQPEGTARQLSFDLDGPDPDLASISDGGDPPPTGQRAVQIQQQWIGVSAALRDIRGRFGPDAVGPAAFLGNEGLRLPGRGAAPWGPTAEPDPS